MPLHGKIVVIKRSGRDGTEFPLTATCLFGRKPDCDIRIQLPHVSKEHCRIDLNENKEVILTNLSSVNATHINGEVLQQSERLKHGDVITIVDRSFRFEYPPAPTPKKRSSTGGKVLRDQQVGDTVTVETDEKKTSEVSADPHLRDETNHENIQQCLEKTVEYKEDDSLLENKTTSPFSDLYHMIKKSLDVSTPMKSSASLLQTPSSRFCTPKPGSVRKNVGQPGVSTKEKSTPKRAEVKVFPGAGEFEGQADSMGDRTTNSVKKQRKSFQVPTSEMARPTPEEAEALPQKRNRSTPQKFTACEVIEQIAAEMPKSPIRRRSKEATVTMKQEAQAMTAPTTDHLQKASPSNSVKVEKVKEVSRKRRSGELAADLPTSQMKKKRVSFGAFLSPELFDKRLPPDSPLRKGATPRRSLCRAKPKESLLRRASVIGFLKEFEHDSPNVQSLPKMRTPPKNPSHAKNVSPRTPKSKTPSPKASSPAKKSTKSKTPSPKATSSVKMSPKSKTPSPKASSPAKKSPKSKTPSPKATSSAKKSPKSKTPSPKATASAKKSPKSKTPSPKATASVKKSSKSKTPSPKPSSPAKKSAKSKTPSPEVNKQSKTQHMSSTPGHIAHNETPTGKRRLSMMVSTSAPQENAPTAGATPAKTPLSLRVQTPTVQGRFSVSRISTPSPVAEDDVSDNVTSITVTPKIPLRRKSLKSTSQKTASVTKNTVKVMLRRSSISRASIKAINSWADIVKFGQTKAQVAAPAKRIVTKKALKKALSKPQTPARKVSDHVSTGHADSPVTIVVGRAYKQKVVQPTGAAPRVVTNIALFKKDMKMDEDMTGISEMFKTPVNEGKRKAVISDSSVIQTPVGTSVVDPSVLTTPEEPGEMMVSPLSVASTLKDRQYNSEAVQRLLNVDQESSFVSDVPALETHSNSSEQQSTTPKQKPELKECLTGVKRIMKTPRQKAEPVEDLRGKLLKTPKQKLQQEECLTGVKRIMKTPKQKAAPVEDIRGKLLVTPKQKLQQEECLTGVKRIMKTPKRETGTLKDLKENLLKSPAGLEGGGSLDGVELLKTPRHMQESNELSEMAAMKTPNMRSTPVMCLTGIKRIMKTPKEKSAPVEDMVGVKRLMKTPREKGKPVEYNFGIKRLMKSPRLRGNAPVEDFEGLQKLLEVPLTDSTGHVETNEVDDQTQLDCGFKVSQVHMAKDMDTNEVCNSHREEVPRGPNDNESSDARETISQAAVDGDLPLEKPKVETDENSSEEQLEVETATTKVTEIDTTSTDHNKKSIRARGTKTAQSKAAKDKQEAAEHAEDLVIPGPVRGRRGKKAETTAPPAVRQPTRNTSTKNTESIVEKSAPQQSKTSLKPKRGRNARTVSEDQAQLQQVATETVPEAESEQVPPVSVDHKAIDCAASLEKVVSKPRRGRKNKEESKQCQSVPEQQDVLYTDSNEVPQADVAEDANQVCSDQMEVVSKGNDENKSEVKEIVPQAPVTESLPKEDTAPCKKMAVAVIQKRTVRGRRAKIVESKAAENEQEAKHPEDSVVPASVRGRNWKKTEATAPSAVRKTTRSRNAKAQESTSDHHETAQETQSQSEPQKNEAVSDQHLVADAQPQQPINAVGKGRRGRKTKPDTVEQVAKDTVVTVEAKHPAGRSKRGRNAKQEDEKLENDSKATSIETANSEEPVKKIRRTRKAGQDHEQPREEEIQSFEMVVAKNTEAALVEPMKTNKESVAAKPRRGGRKTKVGTESETPVESIQEVSAVSSTDQSKLGRRGKQVIEEAGITTAVPEERQDHELEAEVKKNADPNASVIKSRARGVKKEVSQTNTSKRARRGAALLVENNAESIVLVSESASVSVEPARRGRRAAAKATDNVTTSSDLAHHFGSAAVEDTKTSQRSVKWKADLEVFEFPKETPVKAVRGRKSKLGKRVEAESKNVSKDANKSEEEDLSDKVASAQPVKRARRGAKVAEEAESSSKVDPEKCVEAEMQPKTRRGRAAKK